MPGYGYTAPTYGYLRPQRRPQSLALAAAGGVRRSTPTDPFGLLTDTTDSARVARANPPAAAPAARPASAAQPVTQPGGAAVSPSRQPVDTAPSVKAYDLNTDPALQQVNALIGMNDEQANAEAVKQKKQLLLEYGDPELARAVLGEDPTVQAAGQNQFSTRAQLGQQRDRNVHDLTEQLNNANLFYGGYRVTQEEQGAKDYENALAQAAAGVNAGLSGISGNLAAALAQSRRDQAGALFDAYGRHALDPGADLAGTGINDLGDPLPRDETGGGLNVDPFRGPLFVDSSDPYADRLALALAAKTRRPVGY